MLHAGKKKQISCGKRAKKRRLKKLDADEKIKKIGI